MKGLPSQPDQVCTNLMELTQWEGMSRPLQPNLNFILMKKKYAQKVAFLHNLLPWAHNAIL
jgi:hypothetical protein